MATKVIPQPTGEVYIGENPAPRKYIKVTMGALAGDVITGAVQAVYNLLKMTIPITVTNIYCYTSVAWTTSVTITVGDAGNAAGWLVSAHIAPQTAVTFPGLLKSALVATIETYACGVTYNGSAATPVYITATVGGANPAAGQTVFFIEYFENTNL